MYLVLGYGILDMFVSLSNLFKKLLLANMFEGIRKSELKIIKKGKRSSEEKNIQKKQKK